MSEVTLESCVKFITGVDTKLKQADAVSNRYLSKIAILKQKITSLHKNFSNKEAEYKKTIQVNKSTIKRLCDDIKKINDEFHQKETAFTKQENIKIQSLESKIVDLEKQLKNAINLHIVDKRTIKSKENTIIKLREIIDQSDSESSADTYESSDEVSEESPEDSSSESESDSKTKLVKQLEHRIDSQDKIIKQQEVKLNKQLGFKYNPGYVYMVQKKIMIGTKIVKIGRSKGEGDCLQRVKSYGINAQTHYFVKVKHFILVEELLKTAFKREFKLFDGQEEFKGDFDQMKHMFNLIVSPFI